MSGVFSHPQTGLVDLNCKLAGHIALLIRQAMVLCSTQLFAQDTHDTHALGSVPGGCGREIMLLMHLGMGVDD